MNGRQKLYNYVLFDLDGTLTNPELGITSCVAYALEKFGITDKSKTIMVGDRNYDILGAKENGLDSVGVLFGFGDKEELTEAGATYIVDSVEEILPIITTNADTL